MRIGRMIIFLLLSVVLGAAWTVASYWLGLGGLATFVGGLGLGMLYGHYTWPMVRN